VPNKPQRFRTRLLLRLSVVLALALWVSVSAIVLLAASFEGLELDLGTVLGLTFFVGLFSVAALHYWRRAFILDDTGVTVCGAFSFSHLPWSEIRGVESHAGLLPGYTIMTRRGGVSFFAIEMAKHTELANQIERLRHLPQSAQDDSFDEDSDVDDELLSHQRRKRRRRRR